MRLTFEYVLNPLVNALPTLVITNVLPIPTEPEILSTYPLKFEF
jgi:hypothetical protein